MHRQAAPGLVAHGRVHGGGGARETQGGAERSGAEGRGSCRAVHGEAGASGDGRDGDARDREDPDATAATTRRGDRAACAGVRGGAAAAGGDGGGEGQIGPMGRPAGRRFGEVRATPSSRAGLLAGWRARRAVPRRRTSGSSGCDTRGEHRVGGGSSEASSASRTPDRGSAWPHGGEVASMQADSGQVHRDSWQNHLCTHANASTRNALFGGAFHSSCGLTVPRMQYWWGSRRASSEITRRRRPRGFHRVHPSEFPGHPRSGRLLRLPVASRVRTPHGRDLAAQHRPDLHDARPARARWPDRARPRAQRRRRAHLLPHHAGRPRRGDGLALVAGRAHDHRAPRRARDEAGDRRDAAGGRHRRAHPDAAHCHLPRAARAHPVEAPERRGHECRRPRLAARRRLADLPGRGRGALARPLRDEARARGGRRVRGSAAPRRRPVRRGRPARAGQGEEARS